MNFNLFKDIDTKIRIGSYISGLIFSIGWWLFIDAVVYSLYIHSKIPIHFIKYMPGIGSSFSFFLINTLEWEAINANYMTYHNADTVACRARSLVIIGLMISIASVIGSIIILTKDYINNNYNENTWPGIAIFLQTIFIFISTYLMKLFTIPFE